MPVSILGALIGAYLARKWWLALLLAIVGALVGRAFFDAFLYFQFGLARDATVYAEAYISSAITGVVVFPAYFFFQARRTSQDAPRGSNEPDKPSRQKPGKWTSAR